MGLFKGFEGRTAVVTGTSSPDGIGFASARLLGRAGAKVALLSYSARVEQRAEELCSEGIDARAWPVDLIDHAATLVVANEVLEHFGAVHVLVNNAGMGTQKDPEVLADFCHTTEALWDKGIATNLKTTYNATKAFVDGMVAQGYGRIVNMSSVTGPIATSPGEAAYSAAKAAMCGLTRTLAVETARHGVTVNAVAPGWIASAAQIDEEQVAGRYAAVGRSGTVEEVASLVAFLAAEEASYITGQVIVVDGGNVIQERKGP
ncbi:MAG: SDR family NAD(P)-dependent oxidoreductase [Kiritimatiellales bacterium]